MHIREACKMIKRWEEDDGESIRQFLYYFYRFSKIPVSLAEKEQIILSYVSAGIDPDPALCSMKPFLGTGINAQYQSFYGILVGAIHLEGTPYNILIGPLDSHQNNQSARRIAFLQAVGMDASENVRLRNWLSRAPMLNIPAFLSMMRFLEFALNGSVSRIMESQQTAYTEEDFAGLAAPEARFHGSEQSEAQLLHMVSNGDYEGLLDSLYELSNSGDIEHGNISEDSLRLQRYLFVSSVALISRSAVKGGMNYEAALTMSDTYIYKMDQLTSANDIPPLLGVMMLDFADEVRKLHLPKQHSRLLSQVLSDIRANIYHPLSISAIAQRLNVSISNLSHTFSKEMGQDLKTYILQEKVREAEFLLQNTDLAISEIAEKLCFSSQPHFQKTFRQFSGTTPGQYRSQFMVP